MCVTSSSSLLLAIIIQSCVCFAEKQSLAAIRILRDERMIKMAYINIVVAYNICENTYLSYGPENKNNNAAKLFVYTAASTVVLYENVKTYTYIFVHLKNFPVFFFFLLLFPLVPVRCIPPSATALSVVHTERFRIISPKILYNSVLGFRPATRVTESSSSEISAGKVTVRVVQVVLRLLNLIVIPFVVTVQHRNDCQLFSYIAIKAEHAIWRRRTCCAIKNCKISILLNEYFLTNTKNINIFFLNKHQMDFNIFIKIR